MTVENVDVMKAVEGALNRAFPGEPVYWDCLPKDFKRPCFTLECQKTEETDANAFLVRKRVELLVTCLAAADAYGDSSREELTRRQSRVMGLFFAGSFPAADRHLAVQTGKGEQTPTLAEVTALFTWMDGRPGLTGPDDPQDPEGGAPRMEHVEINKEEIT